MSRRSIQRKVWRSIYKSFDGSRGMSGLDWIGWLFVFAFVVYMIVVK